VTAGKGTTVPALRRSRLLRASAVRRAALVLLALLAVAAQAALTEQRTADGHPYVAGGIGSEEVDALRQMAPSYSLQIITAARSGAYLAGAHVRIVGPGGRPVLDTAIDAPWLLIDLPSGGYTVQATFRGQTVVRRLTVAAGKAQRVVLTFDARVDDELLEAVESARGRASQ
jgi:hypothetical protein